MTPRTRALALLLLAGCGGGPDTPDDTDPVVDTDVVVDSEPTESDVPVVVDTEVAPGCAVDVPDGACPGVAACVDGRCLVDLDPGTPAAAGAVDDWDAVAAWIGTRSLLLDTRPVDWSTVSADGHAAVAAASTAFDAAWAMMSAVGRLRDGHTFVRPSAVCDVDPGFEVAASNAGACVVEGTEGLVVTQVADGSGWRRGDVLLDIDGRAADDLVDDRLAQPRCGGWASTEAGLRAQAVASLLWRPDGEHVAHVRRDGATVAVPLRRDGFVSCPGRLGVPGETTLVGDATTATLPGGVTLVAIPQMGVSQGADFVAEPLIDALRAHLAALPAGRPLVFDLRGNRGGHRGIPAVIAAWLLPTGAELWRCRERHGDGPDDVTPLVTSLVAADALQLDGPVAVITDGRTWGAGEYLSWTLGLAGRAVRVGAPSNGAFGGAWRVPVDGWGAAVNALRCERPDGSVLDGDPPAVDVPVAQGAADAALGVDSVIEAARRAVLAP